VKLKAKTDGNHSRLLKQIRCIPGVSVFSTHRVGQGFPDVILGLSFNGVRRNFLLEIKDPSQPPSKRKLTPDEVKFHESWNGQVSVVETIEDVLKIIK